jgi:HD-GYP domain-containing protein (c-di-GMP phosphodiesterase class II)
MKDIDHSLFDTSFLEEVVEYLRNVHGVRAWVVDDDDTAVLPSHAEAGAMPFVRYYPFGPGRSAGGIKCAAADESTLVRAEPHVLFGIKGINQLLLRETELQQTSDEMLQLSEQLSFLFKLAQQTIGVNELEEFCRIILEEIAPAVEADYGIVHTKGRWDQPVDILHRIDEAELVRLKENGLERIPAKDSTVISSLSDGTSVLRFPIKEKDGPIGYIAFFRKPARRFFTAYEKKFVGIIEHIISPTVETIRLYGSLQELYINTVKALAAAIDAKDEYTHGHSFRVAGYSNAIGRQLGVPDKQLNDLEIAAYMHDLGKIGVPESILGKPGKLTAAEFEEIKKHPALTNKILQPIHLSALIVDAAVQHHERLDGRGYPYGLQGEQISPYARIIAVADVFDALTSKRPYRDAMPVEKALRTLYEGIDTEFDRKAVQALVGALQTKEIEKEWSRIHPDLKFSDVRRLNLFLVELSDLIHSGGNVEMPGFRVKT